MDFCYRNIFAVYALSVKLKLRYTYKVYTARGLDFECISVSARRSLDNSHRVWLTKIHWIIAMDYFSKFLRQNTSQQPKQAYDHATEFHKSWLLVKVPAVYFNLRVLRQILIGFGNLGNPHTPR